MKHIAVEEHVQFRELESVFVEVNNRLGFPNLNDPKRAANTLMPVYYAAPEEHRIPQMDKYGVDMQILSTSAMGLQMDTDAARATANARMCNDGMYEMTQKYPERFKAFAALALQDPKEAVKELTRCVEELGFVGVLMYGSTDFHYYDEPQYDCIWAKLNEYGLPLYLHCANPEADQIRMYDGYTELLGNTWNWGVTAATHALRIMFSGIFDRYPNCSLILGHMGESLPFLLGRMDEGYDCRFVKDMGRMAHHPSYYMKHNIYVTTSGGWYPETMHCCIEALGADRIMFANDYPHYPLEKTMAQMQASGLSEEQQELIYHKNAERILHLDA